MGPIPFGYRADGVGNLRSTPKRPRCVKEMFEARALRTVARSTRGDAALTISVFGPQLEVPSDRSAHLNLAKQW